MSSSQHEEEKERAKSMVIYNGQLKIHYENGTIDFESGGIRVLRITHLPTPIPPGASIDIVAIRNVTSYTPFGEPMKTPPIVVGKHVESFQEWKDAGIEPEKSGLAEWAERQGE